MILIGLNYSVLAQNHIYAGFLFEENSNKPVSEANVTIEGIDSIFTKTDSSGFYQFSFATKEQTIKFYFTHPQYNKDSLQTIHSIKNIHISVTFLKSLSVPDSNYTKAVHNKTFLFDTSDNKLIFYTDALQLNEHGFIEDFIKNLPVLIQSEGDYLAEGEEIIDITIDENSFYISNLTALLKNIPSFFIERAEIYDSKSTVTDLTGFNDNKYYKTIDLCSKKEYKNSLFGQVYAGISNIERWNTGSNINFFDGNRIFSIIYNSNNTNNKKFSKLSLTDLDGSSSIHDFESRLSTDPNSRYSSFFNSITDFVIDQSNGINESNLFGISYIDEHKKWSFSGDYFFNKTNNETEGSFKRIYFANAIDSLAYYENTTASSTSLNHRLYISSKYTFDAYQSISMGSILYLENIQGSSLIKGQYRFPKIPGSDSLGIILSEASNQNSIQSQAWYAYFPISYKKRFPSKEKRALYITMTPGIYNEKRPGFLESDYTLFWGPRIGSVNNTFEIDNKITQNRTYLKGDFTFSEPISDKVSLLFSWKGLLEQIKYQIHTNQIISSTPLLTDSTVSLLEKQNQAYHVFGISYLIQTKKFSLTQGIYLQQLNFAVNKEFPLSYKTPDPVHNYLLPNLVAKYQLKPTSYIQLEYERSIRTPSLIQTRDVLIVNNALNLERGNSALSPSIVDLIKAKYTIINSSKARLFQLSCSVSFTDNYVGVKTSQIDSITSSPNLMTDGIQLIQYENMKGYFRTHSMANYSISLPSLFFNLDLYLQNTHSNIPSVLDETTYYTRENTSRLGVSLKSEFNKSIIFSLTSNSGYHHFGNTLSPNNSSHYFSQSFQLSLFSVLYNRFILSTDIQNQNYFSSGNDYANSHVSVVNAAIGYRFLSDNSMELTFSVHDLFNQNSNIKYTYTNSYTEELRTNDLKRYFLLTLTYNLKATQMRSNPH